MAKKEQLSVSQILAQIQKKKFAPIYFLMGEESYFIDSITNALIDHVLTPDERDFNQTIFYGGDSTVENVITAARRFPMMAERQLIIVKEAQLMDNLEKLEYYTKQPLLSTILVINYKHKTFDARKKCMKDIDNYGIIFESKKIYENKIPDFILHYLSEKGFRIENKAVMMMTEYIGADLSRLCSELDKLCISPQIKNQYITPADIESNVGINKDYNGFELIKALAARDIYKANLIERYFVKTQKNNPFIGSLAMIFNYFSNLMLCYYAPDKSEAGLVKELNLRGSYAVKEYLQGRQNYSALKTMQNISIIREFDAKAKGFGGNIPYEELFKELIYKLMH